MKKIISILILCSLFLSTLQEDHKSLELSIPSEEEATPETMFTNRYVFTINDQQVKALKSDKWYFFVLVEPNEEK